MKSKEIAAYLKSAPFHPFEVRTSSGQSYRVRSPEMAWAPPGGDVLMILDPDQGVVMIDTDQVAECVRPIKKSPRPKEA